jgi:hypothetical protein
MHGDERKTVTSSIAGPEARFWRLFQALLLPSAD